MLSAVASVWTDLTDDNPDEDAGDISLTVRSRGGAGGGGGGCTRSFGFKLYTNLKRVPHPCRTTGGATRTERTRIRMR